MRDGIIRERMTNEEKLLDDIHTQIENQNRLIESNMTTRTSTGPLLYKIITAEEFPEYMRWHDEVKVLDVLKDEWEIKYSVSGYVRKIPRY